MKAAAVINEDLSHLTTRQWESWIILESCYFYLPLEAYSLKVVNNAWSPFFLVKFLEKIKKSLWACHRLFSDFIKMQDFAQKQPLIVRKETHKKIIYIYT
jgi:hypothetical protein